MNALDAILNGIDATKESSKRKAVDAGLEPTGKAKCWMKYFDDKSGKFYYHDFIGNSTQWDVPEDYIPITEPILPEPVATATTESLAGPVAAVFNKKTGSFSTDEYWSSVGRATDRGGRQLEAFFDVSKLDDNRREAARKREALAKSNIDWKKYKEDKKKIKQKKANAWLLED